MSLHTRESPAKQAQFYRVNEVIAARYHIAAMAVLPPPWEKRSIILTSAYKNPFHGSIRRRRRIYGVCVEKGRKNNSTCLFGSDENIKRTKNALVYKDRQRKVGRPIYTWEESLRQDLNYHNRNQEEWDTLAQNKMEMKKPRMNYTKSQKRTPKALHQ
ncbi:hypothetical protein EVAR_101188_1 [Eumeta japonica]|uniref:Uncharacterized protein n=1 Tax=Eumeta variegata TaxID=151549 RepID=A0A4C1S9Q6_EUMVA|nr:hypothetical protein EVAR_101188_1 [Eumeta japonica]